MKQLRLHLLSIVVILLCSGTILSQDCVPICSPIGEFNHQFGNGYTQTPPIPAIVFDNGSFAEECSDTVYHKVKRMNAPAGYDCTTDDNPNYNFDDEVVFCCDDIGNDDFILLRVYSMDPGPGPISDDTLAGYFNECMIPTTFLDKVPPEITCPNYDTIDCIDNIFDLSSFDDPDYTDNCDASAVLNLDSTEYDINECGLGCITRYFSVTDVGDNTAFCEHKIFVVDSTPFDGDDPLDLIWPEDTTIYLCGTLPEDIDAGFPEFNNTECSNVVADYTDDVFRYVEGVCYKILRRWVVVDWCQFDIDDANMYHHYDVPGKWTKWQLIKVMDTLDPTLEIPLDVPIFSESPICDSVVVVLEEARAGDCTPDEELEFWITIDFHSDGEVDTTIHGDNASGIYPHGEHELCYFVEDGCGNITSECTTLTIIDAKSPTPIMLNGIVVDLMNMGDGTGMIELHASLFNNKSEDNCSPSNLLTFSFTDDPADSVKIFDCSYFGVREIEIFVFDTAGNFDKVTTSLDVQDNFNACGNNTPAEFPISGIVTTKLGRKVNGVRIAAESFNDLWLSQTSFEGNYILGALPGGRPYQIKPSTRDDDFKEGLSTLDIVLVTKHILGIHKFDDPYTLIAADVNASGGISTLDIVEMRKAILGMTDKFENNLSWRFIPDVHSFKNMNEPLYYKFPESYTIDFLTGPMDIMFKGVKIGDVNHSSKGQLSNREAFQKSISFEDKWLEEGKEYSVSYSIGKDDHIIAMQLALQTEGVEVSEILSKSMQGFGDHNYRINESSIILSWNAIEGTIDVDQSLMVLKFKAKRSGMLSSMIKVGSDIQSEAYSENLEPYPLVFEIAGQGVVDELFQNVPNPFAIKTEISFKLNNKKKCNFSIYNSTGQRLWHQSAIYPTGLNKMEIDQNDLPGPGLYYVSMENQDYSKTIRIVRTE